MKISFNDMVVKAAALALKSTRSSTAAGWATASDSTNTSTSEWRFQSMRDCCPWSDTPT